MTQISDALAQFNSLEKSGALESLDRLRKENRELDKIITDAALLVSFTDVDSMLECMISRLLDHFIPEFLAFLVHPPRGLKLREYCYRNLTRSRDHLPGVYYELFQNRFNRNPASATFADLTAELGEDLFGPDIRALKPDIVFPMFGIGGLYGIVILGRKIVDTGYTELEIKYLDRMIRFLSVGMQNGLHYESSITDPKTGLYTHDYFLRRLNEAVAQARRKNRRSGILMLDVDHFKRFNDTWGHMTGDAILVALANTLRENVRTEDCAARFGGEEFTVLVTDATDDTLLLVAERIREAIAAIRLDNGTHKLSVTVSIGARLVEDYPGINTMQLISEADRALYLSKQNGRNRSTLFRRGLLGMAETRKKAYTSNR